LVIPLVKLHLGIYAFEEDLIGTMIFSAISSNLMSLLQWGHDDFNEIHENTMKEGMHHVMW